MAEELNSSNGFNEEVIKSGDYVIIRRTHNKESSRLIESKTDLSVYLGRQKINLNGIFGQKSGSTFELTKSRDLVAIDFKSFLSSQKVSAEDLTKDNRFINDDGKSQKLSKDEIETFKKELSSEELISNLVKNCSTFNNKTSFAQDKYLKKKRVKYSQLFTILKPNVRLLCEMYYSQGPQKTNYLRIDSLSQMLSLCNVRSGGKYLVLDSHLGLLTASVVERLGGEGCVVQVYTDPGPVTTYRQAVDALNLPKETVDKILLGLQINKAHEVLYGIKNEKESNHMKSECDHLETTSDNVNDMERNEQRIIRKQLRRLEASKAKQLLEKKNMDGLLFLSKDFDPINLLELLIQFLADSRPFVVFSPYREQLTECFVALKKRAVFVRLSETWLRNYQVLPDRTRPEMTMSSSSGYLLSGIKVSCV